MRTIAEAITDLATKAKGSQAVPRGRKITDALDALADAMAGTDVPLARCTTIVNAIDTVTANYSGGGGGVDVGAPTLVVKNNQAPVAEESLPSFSSAIGGVAIGDAVIVPVMLVTGIPMAAAGVTATTAPDTELNPTSCDAYVVTVASGVITAVEQWDGTLTPGTFVMAMGTANIWTFDVPALTLDETTFSGQALYLYMH